MSKCFVIAEIGINHSGSVDLAKKLISAAHFAGADAVKFQKRDIDTVYTKAFLDSPRESPWGSTQRAQKEGLEFGVDEYDEIDAFCHSLNIPWFASAWDLNSLDFLKPYNLKYNKVASAMLTHAEFIEAVAIERKPTFISTGMATENMVKEVIKVFTREQCPFTLMHTISVYPCPPRELRLLYLEWLKRYNCEVGYCLDPNTKILTTDLHWISAEDILLNTEIIAFPETLDSNTAFCASNVIGKQELMRPCYLIETDKGSVICSSEHKWPISRWEERKGNGRRLAWVRTWQETNKLKVGDRLTHLTDPWVELNNYEAGYIAGLLDGEGWIGPRTVGFAQNPGPIFDHYENYIKNILEITSYKSDIPKSKSWCLRVNGRRQSLRLLGMIRPKRLLANSRKIWEGLRTWHNDSQATISKIEYIGDRRVIGIQTTTGTLIANGFLSHNSGHEVGLSPTLAAVALGAVAVERHITLDRSMYGSDQSASVEPFGFKRMVDAIREIEEAMEGGYCPRQIWDIEKIVASKLRYWEEV